MASYPVSLDAGINTELTGSSSSSRGPRIPGFKASSLYPPEAKESVNMAPLIFSLL
jgi:hypothetical protein